jgi:hypothetical protein
LRSDSCMAISFAHVARRAWQVGRQGAALPEPRNNRIRRQERGMLTQ